SGAARQGVSLENEESFFGHKGGALGWGAGAALGVALGLPTRRVVATIGDGSMMYAPQALWTAAHHRIPVTYVILNNAGYAIIKAGTQALQGRAAQTGNYIGMDLEAPEISFVALAEAMGVPATRVTSNEMLPAAFEKAFSTDGPYLIDAVLGGRSPRLPV
ncbi:MAG: thiamine pyrophosphate-dependent enzyme, partial [Acidimicrobiia bacterium]